MSISLRWGPWGTVSAPTKEKLVQNPVFMNSKGGHVWTQRPWSQEKSSAYPCPDPRLPTPRVTGKLMAVV